MICFFEYNNLNIKVNHVNKNILLLSGKSILLSMVKLKTSNNGCFIKPVRRKKMQARCEQISLI
jgi:hypothetical protein